VADKSKKQSPQGGPEATTRKSSTRGNKKTNPTRVKGDKTMNKTNNTINNAMDSIQEIINHANAKLEMITKGRFPFSFEEVVMVADADSAGIYIRSGLTPVAAVARAGNPESAIREIKARVWETVDATRTAVERRSGIKDEVAQLEAESEKQTKAVAALEAAGLPTDMLGGVNKEAAQAVLAAARKAVKKVNAGLLLHFGSVCDALGGVDKMKMKVHGMAGGLVVTAGGKPCIITRFPKIANAKGVERMLRFVEADIEALSASRRNYFSSLREKLEQEERLHELAARMDDLNNRLTAMAM
jgi:hypothetical protein